MFADYAVVPAAAFDDIMLLADSGDDDAASNLIIDLLDESHELADDTAGDHPDGSSADSDPAASDPAAGDHGAEPSRAHLGELWRGVLLLVTGDDSGGWDPVNPRRQAVMGEHEFPADAHYGVTSPARVAAVLAALREVDVEAATADARPATRLGRIFRRGGNRIHGARCDFNVGAVVAAYGEILGLHEKAAREGAAIVMGIG